MPTTTVPARNTRERRAAAIIPGRPNSRPAAATNKAQSGAKNTTAMAAVLVAGMHIRANRMLPISRLLRSKNDSRSQRGV